MAGGHRSLRCMAECGERFLRNSTRESEKNAKKKEAFLRKSSRHDDILHRTTSMEDVDE